MPEFGLAPVTEPEAFGPCRNPWDPSRTAGGSSGGSGGGGGGAHARRWPTPPTAAARSASPPPAAVSFGLKPTRGRTPNGPVEGEAWRGFSIGNALTRSVRDCAALLDATQGVDVGAPYEIKPPARPYLR